MAIEIKAFSGFSKRINSTKQPTGGTSLNAVLKAPTSVIKPTFKITNFDLSWNYIQWGNRYFFVDDIIILTNDIAEYVCSIDVLATYKNAIGASSQYVLRSSSAYNGRVMDMKYPTIADIEHSLLPLSQISSAIDVDNGTFVLGLKSKEANAGVAYYAMDSALFSQFVAYLYNGGWLDATDISVALQKMLIDPFDYVVSCMWYPFDIAGTLTDVFFGYWDWSGHTMKRISESNRIKSFNHVDHIPAHPQSARGSYLNASPYTQISVDLYAFGKFVLDPNRFLDNNTINVQMSIDLFTGEGTVKVFGTSGTVFKACATCGIPIQLSQVRTDLTRPLLSLAGSAVAYETKNYIGAAAGICDVVRSSLPQISSMGSVGSISAYAFNPPDIEVIHYRIASEDNATIGRPLCEVRTISSLSGYMECENVDIDSVGTESEKRAIIDYMQGGFFYE